MVVSVVPVTYQDFLSPGFSSFVLSLLLLFPFLGLEHFINSFHLYVFFWIFFMGFFFHILSKDLCHLHKIVFKVIFLFFSYVEIFTACCSRIDEFLWVLLALGIFDSVMTLASSLYVWGYKLGADFRVYLWCINSFECFPLIFCFLPGHFASLSCFCFDQ